jgi:hypothetical protein
MGLALCAFAVPAIALAQDVESDDLTRCQSFGLDDADVTARIHDIRARIEHHEPDMRHWVTAVGVLHGALFGAELVLMFTANSDGPRWEGMIGAISSGLGMITLLTSFPPLLGAGGTLDAMPETTPEERVVKLVRAESLLRRSAESVAFVRSPLASLATAAYVSAVASVLVALGRPSGAYILALGGVALGQGRLLLHPDGIMHEWRRYRFAHPDAGCEAPVAPTSVALNWELGPAALPGGGGVGVSFRF